MFTLVFLRSINEIRSVALVNTLLSEIRNQHIRLTKRERVPA